MNLPTLRPYQIALEADVQSKWAAGAKNVVMRLDTGGGKCLGEGTLVLMFDGRVKPVEAVKAGDLLMGPDSLPRKVVTTCSGEEPLYKIIPVKGTPYVVNESHILSLQTTQQKANPRYASEKVAGEVVNISVRDYLKKSPRWKHLHKGWRVGVDFLAKRYSGALPPYLLGIWLGDGCSRGPSVTTMDEIIVSYLQTHATKMGISLRADSAGGRAKTYFFTTGRGVGKLHGRNPVRNVLSELGLFQKKHVPLPYLTGSKKQRLEVLAGLLDTDGSYTGKGFDYISVLPNLAYDVAFLARSLGLAAYVGSCQKSCNGAPKAEYFRVSISGDVDIIPCRLPHKKAAPRRQKKSVLRTGITVEPIGPGRYFGFTLEGDGLFLLGDFTVTHNTVILGDIIGKHQGASCVIAHRQELVGQLSLALGRLGIRHNLICASKTRIGIITDHMAEFGRSYYDATARCAVASVDTLIRAKNINAWASSVTLWVCDEGHHVIVGNKWESGIAKFTHPQCRGLQPTATPTRADGKGLGRHAHGLADVMVQGPPMRWLIENGYLTEYRVVCPLSDLAEIAAEVGASGDWSNAQLREAARGSHIVSDAVTQYLRWAPGKLGVTFCTDVETAANTDNAFRAVGVRSAVLTGDTLPGLRRQILRQYAARQIDMLCVVDIVSEGFDLPAIEVGIFARPTQSLGTYMQQFGRVLRILAGKDTALIIDLVGNFLRHGPPDRIRPWTLDARETRRASGAGNIPFRICDGCFQPYERFYPRCPHCGHEPEIEPGARSSPARVDGDLCELDAETLALLRGAVTVVDLDPLAYQERLVLTGCPRAGIERNVRAHIERHGAQLALREAMAGWGGIWHGAGDDDRTLQRRFFHTWGTSVIEAMALGTVEATALTARIKESL